MPPEGVRSVGLATGGGAGETLTISIVRGDTGREERYVKEDDLFLLEEDYKEMKRR